MGFSISYDAQGIPGVWAQSPAQAYAGIGYLHGRHRPLQVTLMDALGRGALAKRFAPVGALVDIDATVHRLNIVALAQRGAERLQEQDSQYIDAYLSGVAQALRTTGQAHELIALGISKPKPDRASLLGAFLASSFLGLAQGQQRMERLLLESLHAGADPRTLEALFGEALQGWDPEALREFKLQPALGFSGIAPAVGGSNAWAVTSELSASGAPMLAGDPHLQIDMWPSTFFEVRVRLPDNYWLGATIAGLPGIALGRNKSLSWAGTFAVADNVDHHIVDPKTPSSARKLSLKRRFLPARSLQFEDSEVGVIEPVLHPKGERLAVNWAGACEPHTSLGAFLRLPLCQGVEAASQCLRQTRPFSLHYILAERTGVVAYQQVGCVPRRPNHHSGLYPYRADVETGVLTGDALPGYTLTQGYEVSANEPRLAEGGIQLATLAQPDYRRERIRQLLELTQAHTTKDFQRIQCDLYSLQAKRLLPCFLPYVPEGSWRQALEAWDLNYNDQSVGAYAFDRVYRAAWRALSHKLGRDWFAHAIETTEVTVWWARAFDDFLAAGNFEDSFKAKLSKHVATCCAQALKPWGAHQQVRFRHALVGFLPAALKYSTPNMSLVGSIATVCQGNRVPMGGQSLAIGPAYRMVADLAEDCVWSALPGGIDGSRFSSTYSVWLEPWRQGRYHALAPPTEGEQRVEL